MGVSQCLGVGRGSAAPWRGLFMAVSGSPTASQVEVQKPPEAGSAEFEVFAGVK